MSIQSEVNRITANIASAYTAAAEKNAEMPEQQNSKNLAATILSIPEGAELPALSSPVEESEVFLGKEYIDDSGGKKTGTFTITEEITEQDSLISRIKAALQGKISGLPTQEKTVEITENGTVEITPDDGYALSKAVVNVNVENGVAVEGIPEGYAKVDFIRFTGEQYVDTGIVCDLSTKIKVLYVREGSTAQYLYGVVSSDNKASVTAYLSSSGTWRFGAKSTSRNISIDSDVIHLAVVDKSGIKHEGGTTTFSGTADFTAPGTLILGGARQSSGACSAQFEGKVLLFEIWQDTEPALKLMPVVGADGVHRFWDSVSETFFDSITDTALEGGNL